MNVRLKKRFLKELATLPSSHRKEVETFVFAKLPTAKALAELGNVEAMKVITASTKCGSVIGG